MNGRASLVAVRTRSAYVAIDLGTANVRVYVRGRGIVLNEPCVVAYSASDNHVVAVGSRARQMLGQDRIIVTQPMRDGVIADHGVTEALLRYLVRTTVGKHWLFRPVVVLGVPAGVTRDEARALLDVTIQAGAKEAHLMTEMFAAAIGANIPILSPSGNMVVAIGASKTEAAVIALNDVVVSRSIRIGGNKIDELIATYVRRKYDLMIGERTSEEIKVSAGSALPIEGQLPVEIRGRDARDGSPRTQAIDSSDVAEAATEALAQIVGCVAAVLEDTPPTLVDDVARNGMILTGGGALLRNLDKLLSLKTGVPAFVSAEDPRLCAVIGAARAMDDFGGRGPEAASVGARPPRKPIAPYMYAAAVPPRPGEA